MLGNEHPMGQAHDRVGGKWKSGERKRAEWVRREISAGDEKKGKRELFLWAFAVPLVRST